MTPRLLHACLLAAALVAAVVLVASAGQRPQVAPDDALPAMAAEPITRRSGFVRSKGEQIYYETAGQGPAVVLCHGAGGNHVVWYQQVPVLARQFQVITWDQRGFGRSSNTSDTGGPVVAVGDLRKILSRLRVNRADLVGQSMGGWTALGFAMAYPQRVRSLVLADSTGGISTPEIEAAIDTYLKSNDSALPPAELPLGQHPALDERFSRREPIKAFLFQELSLLRAPVSVGGQVQKNTTYSRETLKQLRVPVLFIVGSDDRIFPPALIRQAAALVPNARVVEIPGTGHSPYFEEPEAWNAAVLRFLHEGASSRAQGSP